MSARASISTTVFSKAYLARVWESRHQLQDYERRGFAQFFYLTVCGHVESVLALVIKRRLNSIRFMLSWEKLGPVEFKDGDQLHLCALKPVVESLVQVVEALKVDADSAPLRKLIELFGRVFPQALKDVVGADLYDDLIALADLRNLFAHGRDLVMEFEDPFGGQGSLERNQLRIPAERLHRAGIIESFSITGRNYHEFQAVFFGDDALMYFYKRVQEIEQRLDAFNTFLPEKSWHFIKELPNLGAEPGGEP